MNAAQLRIDETRHFYLASFTELSIDVDFLCKNLQGCGCWPKKLFAKAAICRTVVQDPGSGLFMRQKANCLLCLVHTQGGPYNLRPKHAD